MEGKCYVYDVTCLNCGQLCGGLKLKLWKKSETSRISLFEENEEL